MEQQVEPKRREATANFRITSWERRALEIMAANEGYITLSDLLRAIVREAILNRSKREDSEK